MSKNLVCCLKELSYIGKLSPKLRKKALSELACNECYYKAIKEIALNIINKNIKPENPKKLKTHWKNIVKFTDKNNSKYIKRTLVNQSGGWIWSIIPIAISLLNSLL